MTMERLRFSVSLSCLNQVYDEIATLNTKTLIDTEPQVPKKRFGTCGSVRNAFLCKPGSNNVYVKLFFVFDLHI